MKFDDIVAELGEFGPYQKKIYFLVCLVGIPAAFQTMVGVFTLAVPDHRCAIRDLENDTYKSQGQWHADLVNKSIPWSDDDDTWEQCDLYKNRQNSSVHRNETTACNQWVYSKDPFENTFVTEHNLVCGDISKRTYANMILMGGLLGGSLVLGLLSDIIGRKKTLLIGVAGQFAFGLATAFAPNYEAFVILRFFTMFCGIGMFLAAFVIGMEIVGPGKRKIAGMVIEMFWTVGLFIETGMAYGIREWSYLQIAVSVPIALLLVYAFVLPESPRWLISQGRYDEAVGVLKTAAEGNGVTLSEKALDLENLEQEGSGEKIWHMFTIPRLLIRCLIIFFNWFVASLVYYGLSLNVGSLSGDIYLNSFLSALVELASYVLCLLLLDVLGRKVLQCSSMLLGGLACIATLFPVIFGGSDLEWLTVVLSLIGKFGASAAFAVIYVFSAELFPTVMRNSGMGVSSLASRIGGILAPFIADISNVVGGDFSIALPLLIFGGVSIAAGLLALFLPETAHQTLPETIEDAKHFGRKRSTKTSYALDHDLKDEDEKGGTANPVFILDTKH